MVGMLSRWPVVIPVSVGAGDRGEDGVLTEAAIMKMFEQARAVYLDGCGTVHASDVEIAQAAVQRGPAAASDEITISVSVVEVYDDHFTMNARLRSDDGGEIAGAARCSLTTGSPVTREMRDEFIAIAHAAQHYH
jgi:acyl-CoA thioesterase FadM